MAKLHTLVIDDDVPVAERYRDMLLRDLKQAAATFRVVRADDGSVRQMRAAAEPLTDPAGTLIAVRGAYQDVSADHHMHVAFAAREQPADSEPRAEEERLLATRLRHAITPRTAAPAEAGGLNVAARYLPAGPPSLVCGDSGSPPDRLAMPGRNSRSLSAAMSCCWRTRCAPRDRVMTFGAASGTAVGLTA